MATLGFRLYGSTDTMHSWGVLGLCACRGRIYCALVRSEDHHARLVRQLRGDRHGPRLRRPPPRSAPGEPGASRLAGMRVVRAATNSEAPAGGRPSMARRAVPLHGSCEKKGLFIAFGGGQQPRHREVHRQGEFGRLAAVNVRESFLWAVCCLSVDWNMMAIVCSLGGRWAGWVPLGLQCHKRGSLTKFCPCARRSVAKYAVLAADLPFLVCLTSCFKRFV